MKVFPYTIQHIQLESWSLGMLKPPPEHNGYYLVFWWKSIPLGELYLDAGQPLEDATLSEAILQAITPAVRFYGKKFQLPEACYSGTSFALGSAGFSATLDAIASACFTSPLPEVVNVSVIICTRNRSAHLKNCLDALMHLACLPAEIIVVDNAPSDDAARNVVAQYAQVKYRLEPRAGLDIARNTGAYLASCPVIAYADDDVQLHPLWVYEIWRSFLDPQVAALTGLVFAADLSSEAQQIFEKYWSFNRGYMDKVYNTAFFRSSKAPPVWEIGAGASMAFRKSVLDITGYFDERLDVGAAGCNGDSEIWYRILLNGYTILYNPRVASYHSHRSDLASLRKQIFNYIRGHVVASLIQQKQNSHAAYHWYVYWELPKYYLVLFKRGFPSFTSRYSTLLSEVRGLFSGLRYFRKHKHSPSNAFS